VIDQAGEGEAADDVEHWQHAGVHSVGFEADFFDTRVAHGVEHAEHLLVAGILVGGDQDAGFGGDGRGLEAAGDFRKGDDFLIPGGDAVGIDGDLIGGVLVSGMPVDASGRLIGTR
jgi:hypothetical protein